ncbi:YlmC/YmxH family sporulation protein [Bacillaceae bacterium]
MRFSQLSGKEIVNLDSGERLGVLGQSDLVIDPETGAIDAIVLPAVSFFAFGKKKNDVVIPWQAIRKIGSEMIIVELGQKARAYE